MCATLVLEEVSIHFCWLVLRVAAKDEAVRSQEQAKDDLQIALEKLATEQLGWAAIPWLANVSLTQFDHVRELVQRHGGKRLNQIPKRCYLTKQPAKG